MQACQLKVELLSHTPNPEETVALGARICYAPIDLEALQAKVANSDQKNFIAGVIQSGHLSVLEHASFTFGIEGVSRTLLAEVTRHRIASFSVQSQRYVSMESGFDYVIPPAIAALGEAAVAEYEAQMATMHGWYADWQRRLAEAAGGAGEKANQDARFVLPGACATRMIISMNARELLHFFSLRCCRRAQWEIRAMADEMLKLCCQIAPAIFAQAGPPCVRGGCTEGKRSCGEASAVRAHIEQVKAG
jgi:thymidylate synthase (FAD)